MDASPPLVIAHLVARAAGRQQGLAELVRSRRSAAQQAAEVLATRFGATRVVLFGSLARGTAHERSDVDLAVWGVSAAVASSALEAVTRILDAPVDLIRMEDAPASLAVRVRNDGVELVSGR